MTFENNAMKILLILPLFFLVACSNTETIEVDRTTVLAPGSVTYQAGYPGYYPHRGYYSWGYYQPYINNGPGSVTRVRYSRITRP